MSTKAKDCISAILERRSVRSFDPARSISEEDMRTIVECGMSAPTAVNQREFHFVVVRDQALRTKLAGIHPYCKFVADPTAVGVLVCVDLSKCRLPDYWVQDLSAATENMLVAAAALGIGSTWCGVYPSQAGVEVEARKVLGIPESFKILNFIAFGYPMPDSPIAPRTSRFDAAHLHTDGW